MSEEPGSGRTEATGRSRSPAGSARVGRAVVLGVLLGLASTAHAEPEGAEMAPLWDWIDPEFTRQIEARVDALGLSGAVVRGQLGFAVVDLTEDDRWPVAAFNGDQMFYAASLPKIAIMLAVFEQADSGRLVIDERVEAELVGTIRRSSNPNATALMHRVGKPRIAEILESPRYRLYDRDGKGGIWAGKDYAKQGLWKRDPIANLSHAATPIQAARFFCLLQAGRLVSPEASRRMKRLLADSAMRHKFVWGLDESNPNAVVHRKSGTWRDYHADAALIHDEDTGVTYVASALAQHPDGGQWLYRLITAVDSVIAERARVREQAASH